MTRLVRECSVRSLLDRRAIQSSRVPSPGAASWTRSNGHSRANHRQVVGNDRSCCSCCCCCWKPGAKHSTRFSDHRQRHHNRPADYHSSPSNSSCIDALATETTTIIRLIVERSDPIRPCRVKNRSRRPSYRLRNSFNCLGYKNKMYLNNKGREVTGEGEGV